MRERSRIFALTGDAVVRFTLDGSQASDVQSILSGVGARCVAVDPRHADRVFVGTFDSGVYASHDGGDTWREDEDGLSDRRVLSIAVSPSHQEAGVSVLYAGLGGVMRSLDGGASWIDHNPQAHSDAHQLLTHSLAPQRLYEAAGQGVARSEDLGETWSKFEHGLDRHYAWAQALDPANPDLWYVAASRSPSAAHGNGDGQARLWRSRGDGWSAIDSWGEDPGVRRTPYALSTLPEHPGRLIVALRGGTLLVTDDAGDSWSQPAVGLSDVLDLAGAAA